MSSKKEKKKENIHKENSGTEIFKEKDDKKQIEKLKNENEKLKKELEQQKEILSNTQLQYITLKNEFDAYQRRTEKKEKDLEKNIFEKLIINLLPILELFENSYEHLPKEFANHKWSEGLSIISKKINSFLSEYNIYPIKTVGEVPNDYEHEIIGTVNVEDDKKNGVIVSEVKKGYIVKYSDNEKVLLPAKVIIGQKI